MVRFDNCFDDKQAQPGSLDAFRALQTTELRKEEWEFFLCDSDTRVFHCDAHMIIFQFGTDRDLAASARELDGIANKIPNHAIQLNLISRDFGKLFIQVQLHRELLTLCFWLLSPGCLLQQSVHLHRSVLHLHVSRFGAACLEKTRNQVNNPAGAVSHAPPNFFFRVPLNRLLQFEFRLPHDDSKGGFNIVN